MAYCQHIYIYIFYFFKYIVFIIMCVNFAAATRTWDKSQMTPGDLLWIQRSAWKATSCRSLFIVTTLTARGAVGPLQLAQWAQRRRGSVRHTPDFDWGTSTQNRADPIRMWNPTRPPLPGPTSYNCWASLETTALSPLFCLVWLTSFRVEVEVWIIELLQFSKEPYPTVLLKSLRVLFTAVQKASTALQSTYIVRHPSLLFTFNVTYYANIKWNWLHLDQPEH